MRGATCFLASAQVSEARRERRGVVDRGLGFRLASRLREPSGPRFCQLLEAGAESVGGCSGSECRFSSSAISSSQPVKAVVLPPWSVRRPSIGWRSRSISSSKRRRSDPIDGKSRWLWGSSQWGRPCIWTLGFSGPDGCGAGRGSRGVHAGQTLGLGASVGLSRREEGPR